MGVGGLPGGERIKGLQRIFDSTGVAGGRNRLPSATYGLGKETNDKKSQVLIKIDH